MENGEYLPELFVSDDIIWDLTNCVPFWGYNTGLAYGVLKTVSLFVTPLIFMIVLYINIINKLWNSDKIEGGQGTGTNLIRGRLLLIIIIFSFPRQSDRRWTLWTGGKIGFAE